jgi:hypothetical protein
LAQGQNGGYKKYLSSFISYLSHFYKIKKWIFFIKSLNLIKFNIWQWWLISRSTVVEYSTTDCEIMGLNPAPA